jgi:hypothetical protein
VRKRAGGRTSTDRFRREAAVGLLSKINEFGTGSRRYRIPSTAPQAAGARSSRLSVCTNAAILATGRAGGGLGLPYAREYLDNNVAVAARLPSPRGHLDPRTIIEAVPGGWFYLAALPGSQIIAVFITLATLVPSERRARLHYLGDRRCRFNGGAFDPHGMARSCRARTGKNRARHQGVSR